MYEDNYLAPVRSITCFIHKKQKATHLCTQLQCISNPVLCSICFQDSKYRSSHMSHESALKPVNEAIQILTQCIRRQIKPIQAIYEKTLGHRDNDLIRSNLQKMDYLTEQIQNRINSIKMQVDLQMQLLAKQFQRQILLEKQEFIRRLDDYKRTFFVNLETLKRQSSDLMNFQTSLKFYSNPNTLLLKLSMQTQKRSLDWILQQKKTLSKISKNQSSYLQGSNYASLQTCISKANQMNMMIKPVWTGQKKQLQNEKQLKSWIKSNIDSWVSLPQLRDLSKSVSQQSGSHHSSGQQYRGNTYSTAQNINTHSHYAGSYSTNIN